METVQCVRVTTTYWDYLLGGYKFCLINKLGKLLGVHNIVYLSNVIVSALSAIGRLASSVQPYASERAREGRAVGWVRRPLTGSCERCDTSTAIR